MATSEVILQWLIRASAASFVILFVGWLSIRWMREPIERLRAIQITFAAVSVAFFLSLTPGIPRWELVPLASAHRADMEITVARHAPLPETRGSSPIHGVAAEQGTLVPSSSEGDHPRRFSESCETPPGTANHLDSALPSAGAHAFKQVAASRIETQTPSPWRLLRRGGVVAFVVALGVYVIGLSIDLYRLKRITKRASPVPQWVAEMFAEMAGPAGNDTQLLVCDYTKGPIAFGLFRRTIMLPCTLLSADRWTTRCCLAHEWSHIRRRDILTRQYVHLWQPLLWPQPLYWLLRRELRVNQEFLADSDAALTAEEPVDYAELLLTFSREGGIASAVAPGIHNHGSTLSRRVRMVVQRSRPLAGRARRHIILPLISLFVFVALSVGSLGSGDAREHHLSTGECIEAVGRYRSPDGSIVLTASQSHDRQHSRDTRAEWLAKQTQPAANARGMAKTAANEENDPGNVLWGKAVDRVQLGIRPSRMAKSGKRLRHGDWLRYEVWIRNESDQVIHVPRDPRITFRPLLKDKAVNLVGSRGWASLDVSQEQLDEAVLTLGRQKASLLLLLGASQAPVCPTGTTRGRFGTQPLRLAPGAYPCLAELDLYYLKGGIYQRERRDGKSIHLRSEVAMVQVLPAARLRVREATKVTARARSDLDAYPGKETISWSPSPGVNEHLIINPDFEPLLDEDDIIDAFAAPAPEQQPCYDIHLRLTPAANRRLALRRQRLLGKPVVLEFEGVSTSPKTIREIDDGKVVMAESKEQAESIVRAIKSRLRDKTQPKQPDSPGK